MFRGDWRNRNPFVGKIVPLRDAYYANICNGLMPGRLEAVFSALHAFEHDGILPARASYPIGFQKLRAAAFLTRRQRYRSLGSLMFIGLK